MDLITKTFNNRELSTIIWGIIFLIWAFTKPGVREACKDILKSLFVTKLLIVIVMMVLYVVAFTSVLSVLGIWTIADLKGTIIWTSGVAFVFLLKINEVQDDEQFFHKTFIANLKFIALLEFVVNLYVFGFWIEFILLPILGAIVLMKEVAGTETKYNSVVKPLEFIVIIYSGVVILFSTYNAINEFAKFATSQNLKNFLFPPIFTICYLPYLYLFALYAKYETVFTRLRIFNSDSKLVNYAKRRIVLHFHVNLRRLSHWSKQVGSLKVSNKDDVHDLLKCKC